MEKKKHKHQVKAYTHRQEDEESKHTEASMISQMQDMPVGIPIVGQPFVHGQIISNVQIIHVPPKNKPADLLMKHSSILIKQKLSLTEILTGCEKQNVYNVFSLKEDRKKGIKLFKCKEKSQFCSRNFMNPDCRPYNIIVYAYLNDGMGKIVKTPFLKLQREYKCTCLCCNRPVMSVSTMSSKDTLTPVGSICHECGMCEILFTTKLHDKEIEYNVSGKCSQCGFYCQCPCEGCKEVYFDIKDAATDEKLGMIRKIWAGCEKEILSDADNYIAKMPPKSNWKHRALFLSTVLLLDFQYFEENEGGDHSHGHDAYANAAILAAVQHHHHHDSLY